MQNSSQNSCLVFLKNVLELQRAKSIHFLSLSLRNSDALSLETGLRLLFHTPAFGLLSRVLSSKVAEKIADLAFSVAHTHRMHARAEMHSVSVLRVQIQAKQKCCCIGARWLRYDLFLYRVIES